MNCKCARNLFSPRLDGQLDYREQHRLSEHLESCATCAAEFRKFERTVGLVRTLPEEQAPPEFLHDVLERVREARRVPVPVEEPGLWERLRAGLVTLGWSPRVAVAALSFGLVVGIGGSVLLLRSSTPGVGSPSVAVSQQQIAPSGSAPGGQSSFASSPVSAPAPSGPFEDLVQEMLRRAESQQDAAASDTVVAPQPDWGQDRGLSGVGRQVNTGGSPAPESNRSQNREGRVYIVF